MTAAGLITLTIYYLVEAFPRRHRPLAPVVGVGLAQLGAPLARVMPVEFLATDHWRGLHLIELATALGLLALVLGGSGRLAVDGWLLRKSRAWLARA